jgi:hypothetical protein
MGRVEVGGSHHTCSARSSSHAGNSTLTLMSCTRGNCVTASVSPAAAAPSPATGACNCTSAGSSSSSQKLAAALDAVLLLPPSTASPPPAPLGLVAAAALLAGQRLPSTTSTFWMRSVVLPAGAHQLSEDWPPLAPPIP